VLSARKAADREGTVLAGWGGADMRSSACLRWKRVSRNASDEDDSVKLVIAFARTRCVRQSGMSVMAYNLENLCPATRDGAAAEDPQLVARQLAATAGEDGTTAGPALRDARYYRLLLAGAISRGGSFGSRFAGWAGSQRCPCHR
jgi:hypothetical protein